MPVESSNNVGNGSYVMGGGRGGRQHLRATRKKALNFMCPPYPPWFRVVGNSGLGSCLNVLLWSVVHGGDLLTKPWTRRPSTWAPRGWNPRVCLQLSRCREVSRGELGRRVHVASLWGVGRQGREPLRVSGSQGAQDPAAWPARVRRRPSAALALVR